ncbi:MAG TPA: ABC transporter permease [Acidimicrobiales bacterium]|nr:ABC transporter permease [Acidimicrobiales bacterium]
MPPALVVAGKDLRQRLRDRSAIVIGVVAPLVIAAVMSLAFKGAEQFHFSLGVVDADHGPVAAGMIRSLQSPGVRSVLDVRAEPSAAAASAAIRSRRIQAALVIPAGLSASVGGARPVSPTVLTSVNNALAGSVTESIVGSFVAQLNADRLSVATALAAGAPPGAAARLQAEAARLTIPEQLVDRPLGARPIRVISYYSPAMAIFFVLFLISYTSRSFFVDRSQGMVERMRAAPIRPLDILVGKALSVFVFGLVSLVVVAGLTTVLFGAYWGSPLAVGAVCVAMTISIVCLTGLVIALARTQRQAEGIAGALVFALALLGGNFVFVSASPDIMRTLSLFTPNGWAMRAFTDLSTGGGGLGTAALPVAAILGFSAVVAVIAGLLGRRAVTA